MMVRRRAGVETMYSPSLDSDIRGVKRSAISTRRAPASKNDSKVHGSQIRTECSTRPAQGHCVSRSLRIELRDPRFEIVDDRPGLLDEVARRDQVALELADFALAGGDVAARGAQ